MDFSNWKDGEPNGIGYENYAVTDMNNEWHDVQWWLPACAICNTPSNAHFSLRGYHGWLYDNQYDLIGDDFTGVSFSTLKWDQSKNEWKLERIGEKDPYAICQSSYYDILTKPCVWTFYNDDEKHCRHASEENRISDTECKLPLTMNRCHMSEFNCLSGSW